MWLEAILIAVVAPIVWTVAQALFRGYGQKKGENLATLEDLQTVNRRVESLQASFAVAVAKSASAHGHRFATELAVYRELWERVVDLQQAADRIWHQAMSTGDSRTASDNFRKTLGILHDKIRRLRPFFPLVLHEPLLRAQLPIREMAVRVTMPELASPDAMTAYLKESWPKVSDGLTVLEDAIRSHLYADERALVALDRESDVA